MSKADRILRGSGLAGASAGMRGMEQECAEGVGGKRSGMGSEARSGDTGFPGRWDALRASAIFRAEVSTNGGQVQAHQEESHGVKGQRKAARIWMRIILPMPHSGQRPIDFSGTATSNWRLAGGGSRSEIGAPSKARQSVSLWLRWQLARKPKWRMR